MNNNNNKGEIMNNLKKLGVSALAGSLAAVSAHAVEVTVTGSAQATYVSATGDQGYGQQHGKGYAADTSIDFNASGELENGWTVSSFNGLSEDGTISSAQLTVGMGSLGTFRISDKYGNASGGIDDTVTGLVYEEAWDGTGHSAKGQTFGTSTSSGSITYTSPALDLGGVSMTLALDYDPSADVSEGGHGAATTKSAGLGSGEAVVLTGSMGGLSFGLGSETINSTNTVADRNNATGYVKYAMGPITIGYQEHEVSISEAADAPSYNSEYMGIAFAVNDQLSIGYAEVDETKNAISDSTAVSADIETLTIAYSMGGMTMTINQASSGNADFVANADHDETEIGVSFAF